MDVHYQLPRAAISTKKYSYVCEDRQGFQIITRHHVVVEQGASFIGMCILCILVATAIHRNGIQQESVVVMPTLGVQLETYYRSGKVFRRFVPMGNILAAVINEAVTPFTCYWYLALIVRDERKLVLVFQELRPPLDMLVPIWKSLCSAIANKMLQQSNDGDWSSSFA
ncbi:uncharacterized protein LOC131042495 isoform X2 [Cryptomeria japonica]|uniref:uncharacterized protein LOC131042495 isoform X2 n=1 Tax=Cryptomeria japonica TaxID=3369 RepID=UPI0025AD06CF|nr:uncharacterized protein LOC131042495 isoform X2 [Cryptomeria japonica]